MTATLALCLTLALADGVKTATLTGTVRDADGKPLAGVTVLVNRTEDAPLDGGLPKTATDADGEYTLVVRYTGDAPVFVREVWAELPGHVSDQKQTRLRLKDGQSAPLHFTLARGEPLAGVIKLPLSGPDRVAGVDAGAVKHVFEVVGTDFRRVGLTADGGAFEVFVPPGTYTVRMLSNPAGVEWPGLKAGSRGLTLEPKPFVWNEVSVGLRFDRLCTAFEHSYSYFFLKKDVDWGKLKAEYRPRAVKAKGTRELAAVLKEMLARLKDSHVWIDTPDGRVGTFAGGYTPNWNRRVTLGKLEGVTDCGFAAVGRVKGDGFGYFLMTNQSAATAEGVARAVEAAEKLRDAPGWVVDLRHANGGDERKAAQIAKLFSARPTVYAKSKYRKAGGKFDEFTKDFDRTLPAAERPITAPVVCLTGSGAVSSGEAFVKMMKALPRTTVVGARTRGASGNPGPFDLQGTGLTVWFSRWVDMTPDGTPFEGVGVAPDVAVDAPAADYETSDPTLEKGLQVLREKVAGGKQ